MCYFGISEKEKKIFEKMELRFQEYSQMNNVPLWEIYSLMNQKKYFPLGMIEEERAKNAASRINIRRLYQDGTDDEIILDPMMNSQGKYVFEIPLPQGLNTLQIVPAQGPCMVFIHMMNARGNGAEEKSYITNGIDMGNGMICYPAGNAGIWMDKFSELYHTLHVEMTVTLVDNAILTACSNYILEKSKIIVSLKDATGKLGEEVGILTKYKRQLEAENQEIRAENRELHDEVEMYKNDYESINNSFCWKVTKPFRKIMDLVKGK